MTSADDGMPPRMLTCVETKVRDLLNRIVALVKAGWSRAKPTEIAAGRLILFGTAARPRAVWRLLISPRHC